MIRVLHKDSSSIRNRSRPGALPRTSSTVLSLALATSLAVLAEAAISTTGQVLPDPSTTTSGRTLYIGRTANGTMSVDDGSMVASGESYIGYNAGVTGAATITGDASAWNAGGFWVGYHGSGELTINDGGRMVTSGFSRVGYEPGATGTITIAGNGSTWDSGGVAIGYWGSGELTISDGGKVNTNTREAVSVGLAETSSGTVNVRGAGSRWAILDSLYVASGGTGSLMIADGGEVSSNSAFVGGYESLGTVTVTGAGARWSTSSSIVIGTFGPASLTIDRGGNVSTVAGILGRDLPGVGTLTISGDNSFWTSTSDLFVGDSGSGRLQIVDSGQAEVGRDTYIGRSDGGRGGEIRFEGGTLNTGGLLARISDLHGFGTINTHGLVSDMDLVFDDNNGLQQQIVVANEPDQNVTINLDASVAGAMGAGYRDQGLLTIADGLAVASRDGYLGYHSTASGTASIDGPGSSWMLTGSLSVGYNGAGILRISNGGSVNVAQATYVERFGDSASSIQFDNGTLTTRALLVPLSQLAGTGTINTHGLVSDVNLVFDQGHPLQQQLTLESEPNQNVTVNLDVDGTAAIGAGYRAQGSLMIAGGRAVTSSTGYLGVHPGSKGIATVTGEGSRWAVTGDLVVGQNGMGDLTIADGGTVSNSNGNIGVLRTSTGTATVSGVASSWTHAGSLTVGGEGTGTLTIINGAHVVSVRGIIGSEVSNSVGGSGTVTVTGPGSRWLIDGPLTVGRWSQGKLTISEGAHVSSATGVLGTYFGASTVTVTGDGSRWKLTGNLTIGDFGYGLLTIGTGAIVSVGGHSEVEYNGRLRLEGGTFASTSLEVADYYGETFKWTAGTLQVGHVDGDLTNSAGVLAPGPSAGSTTIAGDFTQYSNGALEIEIGGTLPGIEHDTVTVNRRAALGGQLQLSLIDDFVPGHQHVFTVLSAGTSLAFSFENVASGQRLTTTDGRGSFVVHYGPGSAFNPRQVVLTNFTNVPEPTTLAALCLLLFSKAVARNRTKR